MDLPQRKPLRLTAYDYSADGVYFLTLCALERRHLFGGVAVGGGVLDAPLLCTSPCGELVERRVQALAGFYPHIAVEHHVLMPNHLHLLVRICRPAGGPSGTPAPTNAVIPALVSTLKRFTNRDCGCVLWQRGYHDHVVRDEADFLRIWTYIEGNPAHWAEDRYFT